MLDPTITQAQFDALDPILRAEYSAQSDGSYLLNVSEVGGFQLANTTGLLNSVTAARGERDTFETELRTLRSRYDGIDLDELRAAQTRLAEMVAGGGADAAAMRTEITEQLRADFERQTSTLTASMQEQIDAGTTRADGLSTQLDERIFEIEAQDAILAIDKDAEPMFLLPEIKNRTRIVDRDGRRVVEVVNAQGQIDYVIEEGQTIPKALKHVVADLKLDPRFGRAFGGVGGGSGANGDVNQSGPGDTVTNPWIRDDEGNFNLTEQGRILREDKALATRLMAEAPKPKRQSMLPQQPSGGYGTATTV